MPQHPGFLLRILLVLPSARANCDLIFNNFDVSMASTGMGMVSSASPAFSIVTGILGSLLKSKYFIPLIFLSQLLRSRPLLGREPQQYLDKHLLFDYYGFSSIFVHSKSLSDFSLTSLLIMPSEIIITTEL